MADVSVELLHDGNPINSGNPVWVRDGEARSTLAAIRLLLDGTLTVAGSVTVTNPTPAPETGLAKDATVAQVRDRTSFPLPPEQVSALAPPVTQPISGTITVSNPTADPETGLAKETTLTQVRDRADFPLPAAQVAALAPLATQPVSGTVTVANPTANPETGLAKDATLELVRAQVAAVNANTDAVEALLTTIRDTVLRRTDPLPAGTNSIGHVTLDLEAETLLLLASAARTTSGTSPGFDTSRKSRVALDVSVTAISGTLSPALRVFVDRQGADGLWYPIYTSSSITTASTVSTSIGQGMTVGQSLGAMCRFRWEITGASPSVTFSASAVGK